jgi:hypothetical protein
VIELWKMWHSWGSWGTGRCPQPFPVILLPNFQEVCNLCCIPVMPCYFMPSQAQRKMEPAKHGLRPLKPWAKNRSFLIETLSLSYLSQQWRANTFIIAYFFLHFFPLQKRYNHQKCMYLELKILSFDIHCEMIARPK